MAQIACDQCGKQYLVRLESIESERASITCTSCGHVTVFNTSAHQHDNRNKLTAKISSKVGLTSSLKMQINVLIACLVILVMGGYAVFMQISTKTTMKNKLEDSADIVGQRLSKHLQEPFWSLDDPILKEALLSEMLDRQIYAINLIDRDGKSIYMGYKRDKNWQIVENKTSISSGYTTRRMDIVREKAVIGAVEIYLTDQFLNAEFKQSMITIAVAVMVLIVTILLFVSFIFQRMIIHPITTLTSLADQISMGDLDVRIPIASSNEIGQLARSFDRMKNSLQISLQALKTNN